MTKLAVVCACLLVASCSPPDKADPAPGENLAAANIDAPPKEAPADQSPKLPPAQPPSPGEAGGLSDDRTPTLEGSIDPKSVQGAAQVVQQYFALLEEGKGERAQALWSGGRPPADFAERLAQYSEVHANIGAPGRTEGAAGSLYVDVPVQLYGRLRSGKPFNALGTMTLRRVNDVPGSSAQQRSWHIYEIKFPA
jgi:hypothetical protein